MDQDEYLGLSQHIGMELLEALDDACRAAGVEYFLFAGTLLGAVRSGDWIPWDDDIDVAMMRSDFERFREVANAHLPAHIRFSDARSSEAHLTPIPRLLHLGYEREEFARSRKVVLPEVKYVALDIFVLDRAPRTGRARRLWRWRIRILEKLIMASQTGLRDVTAAPGSWRKKAVELVGLVVSRTASQRAWARRHAAASSAYARSGGDYVCSSNDFSVPKRALLMEVEDFTPAQEVRFGSRSWPAPRGADSILAALYGPTYLTPPPIEEQKPIHFRNGIRRSELRDR